MKAQLDSDERDFDVSDEVMSAIVPSLTFASQLLALLTRSDQIPDSPATLILCFRVGELWTRGEKITYDRIRGRTQIPKSTVSRTMSEMIRVGLLVEKVDPDDRRRRLLEFTPLSERLSRLCVEQFHSVMTRRYGDGVFKLLEAEREKHLAEAARSDSLPPTSEAEVRSRL